MSDQVLSSTPDSTTARVLTRVFYQLYTPIYLISGHSCDMHLSLTNDYIYRLLTTTIVVN